MAIRNERGMNAPIEATHSWRLQDVNGARRPDHVGPDRFGILRAHIHWFL